MPNPATTPRCPHCGFSVFNNRYPKCEKCGVQLPSSLVLSREELRAFLADESQEAIQAAKAAQRKQALRPDTNDVGLYSDISIDFGSSGSDCDIGHGGSHDC